MITPKILNCKDCASIPKLIEEIDCKIAEMSVRLYNNIIFSLNLHVAYMDILDLLNYKRILEYKLANSDYLCEFDLPKIASKIKLLTAGCKPKCPCYTSPLPIPVTTTTTTTLFTGSYAYEVSEYTCVTCISTITTYIYNSEPLVVGQFYLTAENIVVQITEDLGIDPEGPDQNISVTTGKATCAEVPCIT